MNLKKIFKGNKLFEYIKKLSTSTKVGTSITAFFVGADVLSSAYSKIYNSFTFDSSHSGKESSMSSYSTKSMTDFGSGWKGISNNILKLIGKKNNGISETMKIAMTDFNSVGIDLNKTVSHVNRRSIRTHK